MISINKSQSAHIGRPTATASAGDLKTVASIARDDAAKCAGLTAYGLDKRLGAFRQDLQRIIDTLTPFNDDLSTLLIEYANRGLKAHPNNIGTCFERVANTAHETSDPTVQAIGACARDAREYADRLSFGGLVAHKKELLGAFDRMVGMLGERDDSIAKRVREYANLGKNTNLACFTTYYRKIEQLCHG